MLADPHATALRSEPKSARDLMITAHASWLIVLDNLSGVAPWLSDALCRLATGGGFATRALYTDDEEIHFDAMRPVLLNGIDDVAERPDLLDRAILLRLPPIPDEKREEESKFWSKFQACWGSILGALLNALAGALKLLPDVQLDRLPRMADFARFGESVGRALGWEPGAFLSAYTNNIEGVTFSAAEASPVARAIRTVMDSRDVWEGTSADLLRDLTKVVDENESKAKTWPQTPRKISGELSRIAPILRRLNIHVSRRETRSRKGRSITITNGLLPTVPAAQSQQSQQTLNLENKVVSIDGTSDDSSTSVTTITEPSRDSHRGNPLNGNGLHGPGVGSDGSDGIPQTHPVDKKPGGRRRTRI
jgi:hypothetical protein